MIDFWKRFKIWIIALILGSTVFAADIAVQTQSEVTKIIEQKQQEYFLENGHYMQILSGRQKPQRQMRGWNDVFGTQIKDTDYDIVLDVWEGGKGDLHNQKGYRIRYIEPVTPYVDMATTTDIYPKQFLST